MLLHHQLLWTDCMTTDDGVTSDVNIGEFSILIYINISRENIDIYIAVFQNLENGRVGVWILLQER